MSSLDLTLRCPGDDPIEDELLPIVRDALNAGTRSDLESAAQKITSILPDNEPDSSEARSFSSFCLDMAEQIPYDSPKSLELVTLMELVYTSPRFARDEPSDGKAVQRKQWLRYDSLSMEVADSMGTMEGQKYVNFHAFLAHLLDRGFLKGVKSPVYELRMALEGENGGSKPYDHHTQEVKIKAAALYILILGRRVLAELLNKNKEDPSLWFAGPRFTGKHGWLPKALRKGRDPVSLDRWHFWRDAFREITEGKWDRAGGDAFSAEAKDLAGRAAEKMEVLEAGIGTSTKADGDETESVSSEK